MRKIEKIKFVIYGFFASLIFFVLISSTINKNNEGEVGRYQVVIRSSDSHYVYTVILDTKTGDFIEGVGGGKALTEKKIYKGNFKQRFEVAETAKQKR